MLWRVEIRTEERCPHTLSILNSSCICCRICLAPATIKGRARITVVVAARGPCGGGGCTHAALRRSVSVISHTCAFIATWEVAFLGTRWNSRPWVGAHTGNEREDTERTDWKWRNRIHFPCFMLKVHVKLTQLIGSSLQHRIVSMICFFWSSNI